MRSRLQHENSLRSGATVLGAICLSMLGVACFGGGVLAEERKTVGGLYEHLRPTTKQGLQQQINSTEKMLEELDKPVTPEGRQAAIDLLKMQSYQRVTNSLLCAAQNLPLNAENWPAIESCSKRREEQQKVMFHISNEYADVTGQSVAFLRKMNKCFRKARLFEYEVKFPPYEFLTMSDGEKPRAYDAEVFVRCFRAIP